MSEFFYTIITFINDMRELFSPITSIWTPFFLMLWFYVYCYYLLKDAYLIKNLKERVKKLYLFGFLVFFAYPAFIAVALPNFLNPSFGDNLLELNIWYIGIILLNPYISWITLAYIFFYCLAFENGLRKIFYNKTLYITAWLMFLLGFLPGGEYYIFIKLYGSEYNKLEKRAYFGVEGGSIPVMSSRDICSIDGKKAKEMCQKRKDKKIEW